VVQENPQSFLTVHSFARGRASAMDIAIIPTDDVPARFVKRILYDEDFVAATGTGHPFGSEPTLERFCAMQHLVVSLSGDANGFVDEFLAKQRDSRRIVLTVPISELRREFVAMHNGRFEAVSAEAPLPLDRFRVRAIAPRVVMMNSGPAWLFNALGRAKLVNETLSCAKAAERVSVTKMHLRRAVAKIRRCGARKLVMPQRGKCGVTRQAQVPRGSFGLLAKGGALPRRMELPGPTSGAVASDCNR
jgi:hypothetical protein